MAVMGSQKPKRKKFEDMTRDELVATKIDVEQQLAMVKARIEEIRAGIAPVRQPSITDYPREEQKRVTLTWIVGEIEKALKKHRKQSKDQPGMTEAEAFQHMARTLLEPSLYDHLLTQAREQLN